jgi:predicted ATPase/DNA-binding winged helix-turn-helix (wHTH) protein
VPVRVDVLGPLRLIVDGDEVIVPGPKRRALLAVLAMADGRAVPVENLLDALWPGDLPDSARATLQSHVSRLRGHLGPEGQRLEAIAGGYRLAVGSEETDVGCARRLLAAAQGVPSPQAARLLGQARALWRGEPLTEFVDVAPLSASRVTLHELRRRIDETLVRALLDSGDPHTAAALAADLAVAEPHAESGALLHMRALHALGRTADALRIGYEFRRRLASETGLDPSSGLADLEAELASLATAPAVRVPRSANLLRGRDSELAALGRLLTSERLVTVVGPGGVGKTRLAVEAAAGIEPATTVLLAAVHDPLTLPAAVADALGLRVVRGDVLAACSALLAAGPHLVVMDNCEHLLDAVRAAVGRLLEECPELTVLATSREPLGLVAEQRLRLAPLSVSRPTDAADLDHAPAVAVFIDRATRLDPTWRPEDNDITTITDIVRRLDGLPLAIELAAGRLVALGLEDLQTRLDRALDLLGDHRSGTLRQTIAWSYDLLGDDEQRLARFMSRFPDGLDVRAVEALGGELGLSGTLQTLERLVDASMLEPSPARTTRFRMLDTVAAFLTDELRERGEFDRATECFLRWALDLAAWIARTTYSPDERLVDGAIRGQLPNLRAAWRTLRANRRTGDAIALVRGILDAATWRDLTEVWEWSLELAHDPDLEGHPDHGVMSGLAATSAWFRGDLDTAERLAMAGFDHGGNGAWACLDALSLVALSRGDLERARSDAVAAAESAPQPLQSLGVAALAAAYSGDLAEARALNERFASVADCPTFGAFHQYVAAEIDALDGRRDEALHRYGAAIELARTVGSTFVEGIASVGRLSNLADAGETRRALDGYEALIAYWERTGCWVQQWATLRNLADLLESVGGSTSADQLRAAADRAADAPIQTARDSSAPRGATPPPPGLDDRRHVLRVARDAIAQHTDVGRDDITTREDRGNVSWRPGLPT